MSRPLRLDYPGAVFHVMSRGVERRDIYGDDVDRRRFLDLIAEVVEKYRWLVHAYVLMSNHYHLLLETPVTTLSRGMQKLNGDYAEFFNVRLRRAGHLFQGRFKSHLIDKENHLLTVARYIVLNPVRAKMVETAEGWEWSSYRATAGSAEVPRWLTVETILSSFDPRDFDRARREYQTFVMNGVTAPSPWDGLIAQTYLGGASFLAEVQERLAGRIVSGEYRRDQSRVLIASIDQVRGSVLRVFGAGAMAKSGDGRARMAFALLAREVAIERLGEIGRALGVTASGATYLINPREDWLPVT